jgi:hypothetical protein
MRCVETNEAAPILRQRARMWTGCGVDVEWMWSGCGLDVDNLTGDDIAPEGGEFSLIGCGLDVDNLTGDDIA